jgi:hypothetical protein
MPNVTNILNSFTAGELSPRLAGRIDSDKYYSGCTKLQNFGVWAHGGVFRRPGSNYVSTAHDIDNPVRLISYIYSESTAYIIEMGNEYSRFYTQGGIITASGGSSTPYKIDTPYTSDMLTDIKFVQNADVMYMAHGDAHPQKLTRYDHNNWVIENIPIINGPFLDQNVTDTELTPTAITGYIGITATSGSSIFESGHVGSLWKFSGTEKKSKDISAENSYTNTMWVDSNESVIISLTGTWAATVTLQRSYDEGLTWLDYYQYTSNISTLVIEVEDDVLYRLGIKTGDYTSGTVVAIIGMLDKYGYVEIDKYVSPTVVSGTVIADLPSSDATTRWSEGAWSGVRGYPSSVAFFEERLVFAGSDYRPQTLWASQTDDYENFESGVYDNDAYTFTLASNNINIIQSMLDASNSLHLFTLGGEWRMYGEGKAVTATNVQMTRESTFGSDVTQPVQIGSALLFLQQNGKKLRQKYYTYDSDSWKSEDISILSEHLFKTGVVELHYASQPEPTVWMVGSEGHMLGLNFEPLQKVLAFHDNITDGSFESASVIPGSDRDELWVCVKRTTSGGTTTRFIEQFQTTEWDNLVDSTYLDSCLTYNGSETVTVSGLDHLEGLTVSITVSGATHPDRLVTNGTLVLDYPYSQIRAGLKYTSTIQTMSLEVGGTQGETTQVAYKHVPRAYVKFYNTLGGKVGPDEDNLDIVLPRNTSVPMGSPPDLFTGSEVVSFPKGYARDIKVMYINDQPLPCHILAIIAEISISN